MLPRATLPARFGAQLVLRLQQALGEIFEGVTPYRPAEFPQARWPFENPAADFQTIAAVAERLLADLFKQLQQRQAAVRRLECILYYERVPPRVLAISLARASREQRHVATLLGQRLEPVDLTAGVTGLVLVARETSRWHDVQGELFKPRRSGRRRGIGLFDRSAGGAPGVRRGFAPVPAGRSSAGDGVSVCVGGRGGLRCSCRVGIAHQPGRNGGRCPPYGESVPHPDRGPWARDTGWGTHCTPGAAVGAAGVDSRDCTGARRAADVVRVSRAGICRRLGRRS